MAFRNTPHGTSKFSPFYMLHVREMTLPSIHDLKAKLSPRIGSLEYTPRLENLKANLRPAYNLARENARRSHATNKRYYERRERERTFSVGDFISLNNSAIKAVLSSKFRRPWSGPWLIMAQKSRLNYALRNAKGKELMVHVNRMKEAHQPQLWKEKVEEAMKARPKRRQPEEEEEPVILSPGPIFPRAPAVENYQPIPHRPDKQNRQNLDINYTSFT